MARYHVLLSRENRTAPWGIEFGDYDRQNVVAERQYHRDSCCKAANLKIVTSNSAHQSCIDFLVNQLNGEI